MTQAKHTPIPWTVDYCWINSGELQVAEVNMNNLWESGQTEEEVQANAAFIVRACNSYQALLDALQAIVDFEESYTVKPGVTQHDLINKAKAAIAHAEAR
jgi:hypothetical protein